VSTTVNPVTVTAEIAVKRAVIKEGVEPDALEIGSVKRAVPSATRIAKP
tara:strand:- start:257 stop:403 length:147 start_codon:yes stop_codon:yes gene_type:complete